MILTCNYSWEALVSTGHIDMTLRCNACGWKAKDNCSSYASSVPPDLLVTLEEENTLSRLLDPSLGSHVVIRCLTAGTEATCFLAVLYISEGDWLLTEPRPPSTPKALSWHLCVSLALNVWHTHCRNSSYCDGIIMIGSPMPLQIHYVEELPGNLVKTKILIH